ncbi:hypothetical protein, partial [Mesorhizobium sp. M2A.F.Ca.ET.029.05.1.1]|uniref:hypothetical protein n=1 Tax=Mesorhizobium sp. M2A.F.Ca.ET.029.05.1.1 TaxID=2496658 RepID=UPI001AECD02B
VSPLALRSRRSRGPAKIFWSAIASTLDKNLQAHRTQRPPCRFCNHDKFTEQTCQWQHSFSFIFGTKRRFLWPISRCNVNDVIHRRRGIWPCDVALKQFSNDPE